MLLQKLLKISKAISSSSSINLNKSIPSNLPSIPLAAFTLLTSPTLLPFAPHIFLKFSGLSSLVLTNENSPADKCSPFSNFPLAIIPPPTPVPITITTPSS